MPEATEGVIIGGWPYVIAAYSITMIGMAAAITRLVIWRRKIDKQERGA